MTLAGSTSGRALVDHVNVIDGDFTQVLRRVKPPFAVWSPVAWTIAGQPS